MSFHPESFAVLEGYGTKCTKSDFYDLLLPDLSLVFTRDKRVHDARRNLWSCALNTQGNPVSQIRANYKRNVYRMLHIGAIANNIPCHSDLAIQRQN